jgi:hypothetical protein
MSSSNGRLAGVSAVAPGGGLVVAGAVELARANRMLGLVMFSE